MDGLQDGAVAAVAGLLIAHSNGVVIESLLDATRLFEQRAADQPWTAQYCTGRYQLSLQLWRWRPYPPPQVAYVNPRDTLLHLPAELRGYGDMLQRRPGR